MTSDANLNLNPVDAEIATLGWALRGQPIDELALDPEDFYQPLHGEVWRICKAMHDRSERPMPESVHRALSEVIPDRPDRPHSMTLLGMAEKYPPGGPSWHAEQIIAASGRRRLRDVAAKLIQYSETNRNPAELTDLAIAELTRQPRDKPQGRDIGEILPGVIDFISSGRQRGVTTPWADLTEKINGWRPGLLYVVGARPAVGKSIMGVQAATHLARTTHQAVFVASVEMPDEEVAIRMLAEVGDVSMGRMFDASLTDTDWERISQAVATMQDLPVIIDESAGQTLASIRAGARRASSRPCGLGMVVVDYLQLITPRDRKIPREQQISEISRGLKMLAKELHIPVIALAQLNRPAAGDKAPTMANLRESGAIEQDADVVMLLHSDNDLPGQVDLILGKNRSGATGQFPLTRVGHKARLESTGNNYHPQGA